MEAMSALNWLLIGLLLAAGMAIGVLATRYLALKERAERLSARTHSIYPLREHVAEGESRLAAFETLAQASSNGLVLVNSEHHVLFINEAALRIFELPTNWREYGETVLAISRQHALDDLVKHLFTAEEDSLSEQIAIRERSYRVRLLRAGYESEAYAALALEDISELRRLGRARRDMVANISHELRTPITSIRLLVETLQRGAVKSPAKAEPLLEKIAAETDTLHQMAQELLDLAMIELGRAEMRLVPDSLREIVEDATSHLEEMAARGTVTLRNEIDPAVGVLADRDQVARVITNLVHNALKFTPPGGEVVIEATTEDDVVAVMVSDTGPGIARAERDRVFERFYRGDRARQSAGTGLGLAIVKHIVEAHGGRAWAAEPPPNADASRPGARLCFTLPAAAPMQEQ